MNPFQFSATDDPPRRGLVRRGLLFAYDFGQESAGSSQQAITDRSAAGNNGTRGLTSGAEASDFTWATGYSQFTTDDCALSPTLSGITFAGPWTAMICWRNDGTSGTLWSLADPANNTEWVRVQNHASDVCRIQSNTSSTTTSSSALAAVAGGYFVASIQVVGGTITMKRMDTGANVTLASQSQAGTPRAAFGVLGSLAPSTYWSSGRYVFSSFHNVALTNGEQRRQWQYIKSLALARGITVQ